MAIFINNKQPSIGLLLLLVTSAVLTGCVSAPTNYIAPTIEISEPPLGSTSTVYVGEYMVRQGTYVEREAILVTTKGESFSYDILAGIYVKKGKSADGTTYYPAAGVKGGGVDRNPIADPWSLVMINDKGELCVVTAFSMESCTDGGQWQETTHAVASDNSFQQSLIYSGRIGDKINIGYREFSSSIARPAFNNDVEYDLSDSKVIGYKGARLEILEADNEAVTFKMLRNFNDATR